MAGILAVIILFVSMLTPAAAWAELVGREGALITVRERGEAQLGEGTKKGVYEKAKKEALRKAIEENAGITVSVSSTMKNWELTEDVVQSFNRAYVKSVKEISYDYDRNAEKGVYVGEFVIDMASIAKMAEAEKVLAENKNRKVGASVFLFDGEGRMISEGATVSQGMRFNLMVQPIGDTHAYIVNRDSSGNLMLIFPNRDISSHTNPLRAGLQYFFPPRESDRVFAFDGNPGRERFYILLSSVPMADMDTLFEQMAQVGPDERVNLGPIIQQRMAARGLALQSKSTQATISVSNGGESRSEKRVGELLEGTGAFVKRVQLIHVR